MTQFRNQTNTLTRASLPVVVAPDLPMGDTPGDFWKDIKSAVSIVARAFNREGRRRGNGSLCMVGRMFEAAADVMRW